MTKYISENTPLFCQQTSPQGFFFTFNDDFSDIFVIFWWHCDYTGMAVAQNMFVCFLKKASYENENNKHFKVQIVLYFLFFRKLAYCKFAPDGGKYLPAAPFPGTAKAWVGTGGDWPQATAFSMPLGGNAVFRSFGL